nr:ABC transporter ATP-binding protein [uncultured bacterium]
MSHPWPVLSLVRELPEVSGKLCAAIGLTTTLGVVLPIGFLVSTGVLVGAVPAALDEGLDASADGRIVAALTAAGACVAVHQGLRPLHQALVSDLGTRLENHLRDLVIGASLRPAGIGHLEERSRLDRLEAARGVASGGFTPEVTVDGLVNVTIRYASAAIAIALLATGAWWVAAVLAATQLWAGRQVRRHFFTSAALVTGEIPTLRRAGYFADLALTPVAAKEVRLFGLASWVGERFRHNWLAAMEGVWRARRGGHRRLAGAAVVASAGKLLAYLVLGRAAARGDISVGALAAYVQAVVVASSLATATGDDLCVANGMGSITAALQLAGHDPMPATARPCRSLDAADGIRFEDVWFTYPGADTPVLAGLDLEVPAGRSIAIVGANGAGKTTLVKLLARLYEPDAGRITVGGTDIREFDPRAWRDRLAVIFQDFVHYELPVADNVGLGRVPPGPALERAARQAGVLDVVERLPNRWHTDLSPQYPGGVDLSGGEWQRIALARALAALGRGADVLVLDEPTANLDVRAEVEIFDRILEAAAGTTTILISHRFSTVRRADRIVVLEAGRVAEAGDHDQLMAANGSYAGMFHLQAARFAGDAAGGAGDP